jgi:hypothetical protein
MEPYNVISCDPGAPCTLALVSSKGRWIDFAEKDAVAINFKKNSYQNNAILMHSIMQQWCRRSKLPVKAVVELVGPHPGEGVVSACRFVGSLYLFRGLCAGMGIELTEVSPAKWKNDLGLKRPAGGNLKEVSRTIALMLFPSKAHWISRKLDHDRAEAALMAVWLLKQSNV